MNYTEKALARINAIVLDCTFVKLVKVTPSHVTLLLEGHVHVTVKADGTVTRSVVL